MKQMLTAALLSLALIACSAQEGVEAPVQPVESSTVPVSYSAKPEAVLTGKVLAVNETGFLLAGEKAGELYTVGLPQQEGMEPGQTVAVGYSGMIQETYPASPADPVSVEVMEEGEDLVGFYRRLLRDLWNTDDGLNPTKGTIALDLSGVSNLTEGEKSGLVWLTGSDYEMTGISATFEELCEQGYIDKENLYFEDGMLFTIEVTELGKNQFSFDANKWRSGLGAYFFYKCQAVKGADGWSYTVGEEMIS